MTSYYVFNGDADGLCALQQLRLGDARAAVLVTGVKRDIALLDRVQPVPGDDCTVLDVSLDVNRAALAALLDAGVRVRYFDHHHAGVVPEHALLEPHLDPSPSTCTSLLVDRHLAGARRPWAIVGAFGDNLRREAGELAAAAGFDAGATATLRDLGVFLNYNAYGETLADLHVAPAELAARLLEHEDPLAFARASEAYRALAQGYHDDMQRARSLEPARQGPGVSMFVLPGAAWARRVSGVLANELAEARPDTAVALLSPRTGGDYVVSLRVPRDAVTGADTFCRRFDTGGGRRTAAGINRLPEADLERFAAELEREYRAH